VEAIKRYTSVLSARQWSVLLTGFAILLWAYSLVQTKLKLDGYGLIHSYPVTFFISLGILTIASAILWVSKEKSGKLLFLQLLFLIISFWLTPLLIGGIGNSQPGFSLTASDLGNANYIMRLGHIAPEISWRFSWPGIFIFESFVAHILGISNFNNIEMLSPIVFQFLIFLPVFSIFKNIAGAGKENYHWAAIWIFYLSGLFSGILHTQVFAAFFLFFLIAIFTQTISNDSNMLIFSIIIIGAITISHLLTSLYFVIFMLLLFLGRKAKQFTLFLISIIFVAAWVIYGAATFFQSRILDFINTAFNFDLLFQHGVGSHISGTYEHQTVVVIRILLFFIFSLMAIIGFVIGYKNKNTHNLLMIGMILTGMVLAVIVGPSYGLDVPGRIFLFIIIPLSFFIGKLLFNRFAFVVLVPILIVLIPLEIVSQFGNQEFDFTAPSTISSWDFFSKYTVGGGVIGGSPFGAVTNMENYNIIPFSSDSLQSYSSLYKEIDSGNGIENLLGPYPHYYCLSTGDINYFHEIYNNSSLISNVKERLKGSSTYGCIYITNDTSIYIAEFRFAYH